MVSKFSYIDNNLCIEGVSLHELGEKIPTPFYLYSTSMMEKNYAEIKNSFNKFNDILICYAVKASSTISIIKTFADLGAGADIVSQGEGERALLSNVASNKVVFSGIGKTDEEIEFAINKNILQINIESENELQNVIRLCEKNNKTLSCAIRVNPDIYAETSDKISTGRKFDKFGICWNDAKEIYKKYNNHPLIKLDSIAMHIGSQITSIEPYKKAWSELRRFYNELLEENITITRLDLGGGFGISYDFNVDNYPLKDLGDMAFEIFGDLKIKIIIEPGRRLIGDAAVVLAKILYVKETPEKITYIINAGMNNIMRPALYDAIHPILPANNNGEIYEKSASIVGPICESSDIFTKEIRLPLLKAGDFIIIGCAGAYCSSMASFYNSRPIAAEYTINSNGALKLIRKEISHRQLLEVES